MACAGEESVVWVCDTYLDCGPEPPTGLVVQIPAGPARRARFIRLRSGRSIADGWVRFLEVTGPAGLPRAGRSGRPVFKVCREGINSGPLRSLVFIGPQDSLGLYSASFQADTCMLAARILL